MLYVLLVYVILMMSE